MQIKSAGKTNVEIKTKEATVYTDPAKVNNFSLDHAGEYEVANVMVEGIQIDESCALFVYNIEDIRFTYLDGLSRKLENKELELLSTADALIVPFNGKNKITLDQAQEYINLIDPRIVIFVNYENVDELSKVFGNVEPQSVLKLVKSNLPEEGRQVFALE